MSLVKREAFEFFLQSLLMRLSSMCSQQSIVQAQAVLKFVMEKSRRFVFSFLDRHLTDQVFLFCKSRPRKDI